ncbi:MAG: hypothetical protein RBU30_16270 [Polyangia bacterium]|nr:hypothetical protein [Polyangia bacterium]
MKRRVCISFFVAASCLTGSLAAGQSLGRTSFADRATGLRLFLPPRWVSQARSALPGLIGAFRHPLGGRLIISAQPRTQEDTPRYLAMQQAKLLGRRGWTVPPWTPSRLGPVEAVLVEALDPAKKQKVFQIYALHDKHTLVITLQAPASQSAQALTDLRFIAKTARFIR